MCEYFLRTDCRDTGPPGELAESVFGSVCSIPLFTLVPVKHWALRDKYKAKE